MVFGSGCSMMPAVTSISSAAVTTPYQSVPAWTASSPHHSRSCTAVLPLASRAAVTPVAEAATEGVMTRSYPAASPSHGARQRPRESGLRARHWESAAARARSRPAGRRVGATARAVRRHQPPTHPTLSFAWWRRRIRHQRRRRGNSQRASGNSDRRARCRARPRRGDVASVAGRSWRPPPALPPGELGAEHPLVVGNLIARGGAFVYQRHGLILSLRPRFAPGPFSFRNSCYRSLRVDRARLLVATGARQPGKKLAQVIIGDERAASELARHEVSIADRGVHGISAEAGQRARLGDAVRAAAGIGNVLRHLCRPASGAVELTAMDDIYASIKLGVKRGLI